MTLKIFLKQDKKNTNYNRKRFLNWTTLKFRTSLEQNIALKKWKPSHSMGEDLYNKTNGSSTDRKPFLPNLKMGKTTTDTSKSTYPN